VGVENQIPPEIVIPDEEEEITELPAHLSTPEWEAFCKEKGI